MLEADVIAEAHILGVSIIPGAHTPTEMLQAYRLGAQVQKIFPAPAGGPAYVKACLGPMPFLRIVPTQGIDATNAVAYLQAGSFAVGFGNAIFDPLDMEQNRFDQIEARAKILHQTVIVDRNKYKHGNTENTELFFLFRVFSASVIIL